MRIKPLAVHDRSLGVLQWKMSSGWHSYQNQSAELATLDHSWIAECSPALDSSDCSHSASVNLSVRALVRIAQCSK